MQNLLKFIAAEEALDVIKSGNRVFFHGGAATPVFLISKLIERKKELSDVEILGISLHGIDLNDESLKGHFYFNSFFVSESNRGAVNNDRGGYIPVFLSEIPKLFASSNFTPDVALIHVSPPDKHGFCSLGTSVDIAKAAVRHSKIVIAQVNPKMPRVHGDAFIHCSKINYAVEVNEELPIINYNDIEEAHDKVGRNVAEIVEDGATLQLGIGTIPNAVLKNLSGHSRMGLHTEMFSDGVIPLIENGNIDNSMKRVVRDYCVTGFVMGSRKLYDFIDDNPIIKALDISYVNDPRIISQNPRVTAINTCIEIDLTGQVCSDSIGPYQYSGIGGQMDFIRGAALSERGKPIIAITSRTKRNVSRIVPFLKQGAGVVTTRGHIHWVVTEFGSVNLHGLNMEQRAKKLISLAHPDERDMLERAFKERFNS